MNVKKAKALRKEVYGDTSIREKRKYVGIVKKVYRMGEKQIPCVQIINDPTSKRAIYQKAKREQKRVSHAA